MLGFRARCAGDAVPRVIDGELEEVRWFTRDELREAATWGARSAGVQLPGSVSIASLLISGWLADG